MREREEIRKEERSVERKERKDKLVPPGPKYNSNTHPGAETGSRASWVELDTNPAEIEA